ncbi:MAG: S8 family serine peptidase [Ignavibacteriaceae bacterium]|nr:S8 family serine peptidase [Ignavibacteriaceae bacterium]
MIESFSSQGPSTIVHPSPISRMTPKITGVDGVSVTGAGGFPSTFFGTSAAAPHIAAILAQAWSFDLMQTGDDVRQLLYDWPVDLGTANYDNIFGYGRADALNIFDGAPPRSNYLPSLQKF